jgi:hypothetical protein
MEIAGHGFLEEQEKPPLAMRATDDTAIFP